MEKLNCWEYKRCGRGPGGEKVDELGACAAATEEKLNGVNSGVNSGRACWAVSGTLCGGRVQGVDEQKLIACLECDFYRVTVLEEGKSHSGLGEILQILQS